MKRIFFITGTDTGAGKTVLTALLAAWLKQEKISFIALKPVSSGGRDDARQIRAAVDDLWSLDEINPWHFRTAIAPTLAARIEGKNVRLRQMADFIRAVQRENEITLVEGAGGLMSPMASDGDSRDLILKLRATPIIVAQNKLGVVNHLRLTLAALPEAFQRKARVVLMSPKKEDAASRSNAALLAEYFPAEKIFTLPWLGKKISPRRALKTISPQRILEAILAS